MNWFKKLTLFRLLILVDYLKAGYEFKIEDIKKYIFNHNKNITANGFHKFSVTINDEKSMPGK